MISPAPLQVLQITDLHLKADPTALWRGHNVQESLDGVLQLARRSALWPPELILVTGDIVDDETPEGYRDTYQRLAFQLREALGPEQSNTVIAYIPGNHDDPEILDQSCNRLGLKGCGSFILNDWQVIQLDSTLPGDCDGELGEAQLQLLEHSLRCSKQPNILITLHHPLVELGSQWIDTMRVKDAEKFFAVVEAFNAQPNQAGQAVRVVIWGHAHQQTDIDRNGLRLFGSPAAGPVQFTVGSDDFAIDESLAPGLRWLTLNTDGSIETRVERVDNN